MNDNDDTIGELNQAECGAGRPVHDSVCIVGVLKEVIYQHMGALGLTSFLFTQIPSELYGTVELTFDGWGSDPRELFDIPEVVNFCRYLLLLDPLNPSIKHSKKVLGILRDETILGFSEDGLPIPEELNRTGGLFLVRLAFADEIIIRGSSAPAGWSFDLRTNLQIYHWLQGLGPRPEGIK